VPTPLELRDADDATWAVFADELLSRGDPRGELIHLQLGKREPGLVKRERELLKNDERLGGPRQLLASLDATWRRGFLSRVRSPSAVALQVLLKHPSGALLDELVLDNPNIALDELVDAVGASQHKGLRALVIRSDDSGVRFEREVGLGSVLALPALQRLEATVREISVAARAKRQSGVRRLELSARTILLPQLAAWTFPKLTELELNVFSSVTRLYFTGAYDQPQEWPMLDLPPRFASGEMSPVLESLTLSSWNIDGVAAGQLNQLLDHCATLARVDLTRCRVDEHATKLLADAGTRVTLVGR
jgi:hypothetical protein